MTEIPDMTKREIALVTLFMICLIGPITAFVTYIHYYRPYDQPTSKEEVQIMEITPKI